MKRNNSIQLWRFVCSIAIVILHYNIQVGFCDKTGYGKGLRLIVEFFFILSGFLLAHKMDTKPETTPFGVLQGKLKSLYPHYLFSFLILAAAYALIDRTSVIKNIIKNFYEVFLLQNIFRGAKGFAAYNEPAWYVATLIFASYVVAVLLKRCFSLYMEVIAPASVLLIYSYFIKYHGSVSKWGGATELFNIDRLFLRGFAGISLGCLVYMAYRRLLEIEWKAWACRLMSVLLDIGLLLLLVFSFYYYGGLWDIVVTGGYAALILLSFLQNQQNTKSPGERFGRLCNYLGALSYAVYLNQELFRRVVLRYVPYLNHWSIQAILLYVAGLIGYSMLTMWTVNKIMKIVWRS